MERGFYLARNKDGELFLYNTMPVKRDCVWSAEDKEDAISLKIASFIFPEVQWEDTHPVVVDIDIHINDIIEEDDNLTIVSQEAIALIKTHDSFNPAIYKSGKLKFFVARNRNNELYLYNGEPIQLLEKWYMKSRNDGRRLFELKEDTFTSIKWEDESPVNVYIEIIKV